MVRKSNLIGVMKIGIKYCGGCNPVIDRKRLVKRLMQELPDDYVYEHFNLDDCDIVLLVNGCSLGCAEAPAEADIITVAGCTIDGWTYPENELADRVLARLSTLE